MKFYFFIPLLYSSFALSLCEDTFEAIQKEYFSSLDYDHTYDPSNFIADFEERTTLFVECLKNGNISAENETQSLARIYNALYMKNASAGYENGKISFEGLTSHRHYSSTLDPTDEIVARMERSIQLFKEAASFNPNDHRIPGWIAAAELGKFVLQNNYVSDEVFKNLTDAIDEYPEFSLFAGYLALFKVPLSKSQKEKIYQYTEEMTALNGRCSSGNSDKVCGNTEKAPYNSQASMVILGDIYLRTQSEADKSDISNSIKNAIKANTIYKLNLRLDQIKRTSQWNNSDAYLERLHYSDQAVLLGKQNPEYWKKPSAGRIYNCSSCHAGK